MNTPMPLPPHDESIEQALLGCVLIDPDCITDALYLEASDFFLTRNGWVWDAFKALHTRYEAIDNLTLIRELKDRKQFDDIGGSAYVTKLSTCAATAEHVAEYAAIIERMSTRRQLVNVASDIANAALNDSAETSEVISRAERLIETVATRRTTSYMSSGAEITELAFDQFLTWIGEPAEVRGLRSGIPTLDQFTGGFVPGRPYTLYGATGMGKSTLSAYIAINFAEQAPGLIISTEMDSVFWMHRAVSDLAGIPFLKLRSGHLNNDEVNLASTIYDRFRRLGPCIHTLRISDPTPTEIKASVRRMVRQFGCSWVLVDSVNNISVPGVTDVYPKTSAAADCTMSIGVDQGMVVLQTAQTGRNAKMRDNKMPQLNDAEGSSKIENNSSMVIGIYRHQYYVERRQAEPKPDTFPDGNTTLMVLKNDKGPSGKWIPIEFKEGGFVPDTRIKGKPAKPVSKSWNETDNESEEPE